MPKTWRKVKSKWCQACEMQPASEVHHIKARVDGGKDNEENLIDLCRDCHKHASDNIRQFVNAKGSGVLILYAIRETILELGTDMNDYQMEKFMLKVYKKIRNDRRNLFIKNK
jgi:hypothetical protein